MLIIKAKNIKYCENLMVVSKSHDIFVWYIQPNLYVNTGPEVLVRHLRLVLKVYSEKPICISSWRLLRCILKIYFNMHILIKKDRNSDFGNFLFKIGFKMFEVCD